MATDWIWSSCASFRTKGKFPPPPRPCCVHVKHGAVPGAEPIKTFHCCWCEKEVDWIEAREHALPEPPPPSLPHGPLAHHHRQATQADLDHVP